jgi:hypothetical protein
VAQAVLRDTAEAMLPGELSPSAREGRQLIRLSDPVVDGETQIALRKAERISFVLGDDLASAIQFEADVERLRAERAALRSRRARGRT